MGYKDRIAKYYNYIINMISIKNYFNINMINTILMRSAYF